MTDRKNILISGWPGAGASTVAILLTYKLNMRLLRGTETFRYIGKELAKNDTGTDRIDNDNYLEPHFGPIFDKYIDYKLLNSSGFVLEADIGGFRIGKNKNYFSIFLVADHHVRKQRLGSDGRDEDISVLTLREQELRSRYKELHGVDWFDADQIAEKYNLVLDNSSKGISEELRDIYIELYGHDIIQNEEFNMLSESVNEDDALFWERRKSWYLEKFHTDGMVVEADEILREIREIYKEEVNSLPDDIKNIILSL